MMKILVSACLLGNRVRYNAADVSCQNRRLAEWLSQDRIIAFCPEVAAGLPVPRPPAEIIGGSGEAVLDDVAKVVDNVGKDVTADFIDGAMQALAIAQQNDVKMAILKEDSPSCGSKSIYDGTFSGKRQAGQGVTAALLERNGIRVFSEQEIEAAAEFIKLIEDIKY
ncbi:MAG: DUF523 domain-containing protein [Acidobacteriota bacterium]